MGLIKLMLIIVLFYVIFYFMNYYKNYDGSDNVEGYIERDKLADTPSIFILSDMKDYKQYIKDKFKLEERDYKDLVELPKGNKTRINLKKDWRQILNNEIDSIDNDIKIKFTQLEKETDIESQFVFDLNMNINNIYEFEMDKFDKSLEPLIDEEKEEYILQNTDFDNLFHRKEFNYFDEYSKTSKKYNIDGRLIKLEEEPLDEKTNLDKSYGEIYTYETQCGLEKTVGGIKQSKNYEKDLKKLLDSMEDYNVKLKRYKIKEVEEKAFKIVEYDDVTEGLVEKFKPFETLVLNKLNLDKDLILISDTLVKIKNLNLTNNFRVVDRKINYILKNKNLGNEHFFNGEIVIYRDRNHGIHIKIEGLQNNSNYYLTNYEILGIVISDKIEKRETINDNIINALYYTFKDKHVIKKNEIEKGLEEIIDQGSIENFNYLLNKFRKIRSDRGIMVNDFELLMYTGKILLDVKHTENFDKINELNDPSIFSKILNFFN